jgi:hypothetical protein
MKVRSILSVALILLGVACSEEVETPTSASSATISGPVTVLFSGTLQPRSSRFYSYTVSTAGTVSALLASVERNGVPSSNPLEVGIGTPAGTDCAVAISAKVSAALIPQLRHDVAVGTHCVRVADSDGLSAPMTFTVRVIHP